MIKTYLYIFILVFKIILLSKICYAEDFNSVKVNFSGIRLNVIIPKDYCNLTNEPIGKTILNYLNEQSKRNTILPKFKIFFAHCDNIQRGIIYPMGWIGFQKKMSQYENQKDYNNAVSKLIGNTKFFDEYIKDINKSAKEIMKEQYDLNIKSQNISKPKLLWKDDYSITFQAINEETSSDGNKLRTVNVGSSTIVKNAIIHTYISNELNAEPNALKIASILINNSKAILESN